MKRDDFIHLGEFQFAILCMSTSGVLGRSIHLPPAMTIFYRGLLAAIVLYGICRFKESNLRLESTRDKWITLIAGLLMAAHWVTYFLALQLSNVAVGMLSVFTFPIITTFLEPVFLHTKLQKSHVALGLITLFGMTFLIPEFSFDNSITTGAIIGVISAFIYSLRNLMLKSVAYRYDGSSIMFYQMLITAAFLLPVLWIYSSDQVIEFIPQLLFLAVVTTAIGHSLLIKSFQYFSITKASIMSMMQPLYGILWGFIFLKETIDLRVAVGATCILLSIVVISLQKEKDA